MALLYIKKIDKIIRYVFSWTSVFTTKGVYDTCAVHTQVNRQASVALIFVCRIFRKFFHLFYEILLDAQTSADKKNHLQNPKDTIPHKILRIQNLQHYQIHTVYILNIRKYICLYMKK